MSAAYAAFREPQLITQPGSAADFGAFDARRNRYAILWAFFENTAYRNVQAWSRQYKIDYGLYRYIRHLYNPAQRLGVFWQTHIWGGELDREAGDGHETPSAIPISADSDRLREAIAALWQASNWSQMKDVVTLTGAVLGDAMIEVVDDTKGGKVYLRMVPASTVRDLTVDAFGQVKGYILEEQRYNPEKAGQVVTYLEQCTHEAGSPDVLYRTFMNDKPYKWPGTEDVEWTVPYGFVPFVAMQHYNVGLPWGWSEMHPGQSRFREVDDLASKLHDQIRKTVSAAWLFAGVDKPKDTPRMTSRDSSTYQQTSIAGDRPEPGREEVPALYGPLGATAVPLVAPLQIEDVNATIAAQLKELEREYPELQMDIWTASGEASGRALRVARQRAESKVRMRRVGYDQALVRAQQMAVAIGGMRGYAGYQGFSLDSYKAGKLDHSISKRPVFASDPADDAEIEKLFYEAANEAVKVGVPLEFYLQEHGWDEAKMKRLRDALAGIEQAETPAPPWKVPPTDEGDDEAG